MMKRGRVASDVSVILRGAGAPRVVPPGPCWVLEAPHWIALIWHEHGERHMAEISQRDYSAFLEQGCIQFADTEVDPAGPALLQPQRHHTPTSALSSRF